MNNSSANLHCSVASTYTHPAAVHVNTRTGQLTVRIGAPVLKGVLSMPINLGIIYSQANQATGTSLFGLPSGWTYPLSYMTGGDSLVINGSRRYQLDRSNKVTGLRNYYRKNLRLHDHVLSPKPLPQDNNRQYTHKLHFGDGHCQYFDSWGRLICWESRDGNQVTYNYDQRDAHISQSRLASVTDGYGLHITLNYSHEGQIEISFPHSNTQFSYIHSGGLIHTYIDPVQGETEFQYREGAAGPLISEISYPNKLTTKVMYSRIPYKSAGSIFHQDVVAKVESSPKAGGDARAIHYDYSPDGGDCNYTGYPHHHLAPGGDSLFESNDYEYRYRTSVSDGVTKIKYTYNSLHLLLSTTSTSVSDNKIITKTEIKYVSEFGKCQFPSHQNLSEHPNFQQPASQTITYYNGHEDSEGKQESRTIHKQWGYKCKHDDEDKNKFRSYKLLNAKSQTTLEVKTKYNPHYGLQTCRQITDHRPRGQLDGPSEVTRAESELSADQRHVVTTRRGRVNEHFTAQYVTSFEYDARGRLTSNQLTWGQDIHQQGVQRVGYRMTYAADLEEGQLHKTKRHVKMVDGNTVDTNSGAYSETLDLSTGLVLEKSNARGATIKYTYDGLFRVLTRVDTMEAKTTWIYDTAANKVTRIEPDQYTTYHYFNCFGQLIRRADSLGPDKKAERTLETRSYDAHGRLTTKSGILGKFSEERYSYDSWGRLASRKDARGNEARYTYDPVARTRVETLNGHIVARTFYDDAGMIVGHENVDAHGQDRFARVSERRDGLERIVDTSFTASPPSGTTTQTASYGLGRAVTSSSVHGEEVRRKLEASRDLLSRVLQLHSSTSSSDTAVSSSRSYNELGQLTQERTGLATARCFEYDEAGNRTREINFDGAAVVSTYYANNKVKSRSYTDGDDRVEIEYTYDKESSRLTTIERVVNGKLERKMCYDYTPDGRITKLEYSGAAGDSDPTTLSWSYDQRTGQLKCSTDATGTKTYRYDAYGRLTSIAQKEGGASVSLRYVPPLEGPNSGRLSSIVYNEEVTISFDYNGYGQLASITRSGAAGERESSISYSYDPATQMVSQESFCSSRGPDASNRDISYTYDGIGRLISERHESSSGASTTITYSYDAAGNVIARSVAGASTLHTIYGYDVDNRLISISTGGDERQLTYDVNGNLIRDEQGNHYAYNAINQLIAFTDANNKSTHYTYHPNGLRASKHVDGSEPIYFYYDADELPVLANEIQGSSTAGYLAMGARRFARLMTADSDSTADLSFYLHGRKSVEALLDAAGELEASYTYDAWGRSNPPMSAGLASNPFGYCGEYTDAESGLIYLRARYYSPRLMCFTTRDQTLTFNAYAYANSNPIMNTDPTGHSSIWLDVGLAIGTAALVAASAAATVATGGAAGPGLATADSAELSASIADEAATTEVAATAAAASDAPSQSAAFGTDIESYTANSTDELPGEASASQGDSEAGEEEQDWFRHKVDKTIHNALIKEKIGPDKFEFRLRNPLNIPERFIKRKIERFKQSPDGLLLAEGLEALDEASRGSAAHAHVGRGDAQAGRLAQAFSQLSMPDEKSRASNPRGTPKPIEPNLKQYQP